MGDKMPCIFLCASNLCVLIFKVSTLLTQLLCVCQLYSRRGSPEMLFKLHFCTTR